jgi:Undecaprenyl-phosphate glucose phosphotransferase
MLLAPHSPNLQRSEAGFFSKYGALLDILLRGGDLATVLVTACAVYWLRFESLHLGAPYLTVVILALLLTQLIFPAFGLYSSWRGQSLTMEIARVWLAWATVTAMLLALSWMLKNTSAYSRLWVAGWFSGGMALFAVSRATTRKLLGTIRARGIDTRRVVLVGATESGRRIVDATRGNPWMGLDVVGYVATEHDQVDMGDLPRLADMESFLATAQAGRCDQLWIALPMRAEDSIRRLVNAVGDAPTTIRLIPDLFGHQLLNQHATELAGIPVITLRSSRITGYARIAKAAEDRLLAGLIVLLISPLLLLLALGVKLSSPGPVLFRQKRHGLGGREVEVWKFRSMRLHREADGTVTQATRHDPRVTPFGRFLRACSLDELPQFFNVLQGSMSIVGPRPHAIEHNQYYTALVQHYMRRHHVKPGITGWAQINGARGETDTVEKMAMRVEYDLYYIRNWSIALDLRIIALTAIRGFFNKNAY